MSVPIETAGPKTNSRKQKVLLVGFQDQDNLGLRYLASSVDASGHKASIITYVSDADAILRSIRADNPDVVGFSLIFQYMAPDFGRVIRMLRDAGVTAHFTMGGHYSSFEPEEVLTHIRGLDTVIRFEGERTLVQLLNCLQTGSDWRSLPGIAFRQADGQVTTTPLAPPLQALDCLPRPDRRSIDYERDAMPAASILGSRGCPWHCSFCSIRPFYERQGGPLRRLRKPQAVVDEITDLYRERGVRIFLFQDDDFLAGGPAAKRWATEIADIIAAAKLTGKIAFKISCRSDEISPEVLARLIAGGLTHVYMGVESGDEEGLVNMNKHMTADAHFAAGRLLRQFDLSFDFGFMLLDPYSTFRSVRQNIAFLEDFIGDGWTVAPFCRMLPYAGTPIRSRLQAEGRLLGTSAEPDYKFLDRKLDLFYDWMVRTFYERNFTSRGLCHILRGLLFEARLRLDDQLPVTDGQKLYLNHLTRVCNHLACYTLRTAVDHIEGRPLSELEADGSYLAGLTEHEAREEARLARELVQYYEWVHPKHAAAPASTGGFDKSWTLAEADREAVGAGAA